MILFMPSLERLDKVPCISTTWTKHSISIPLAARKQKWRCGTWWPSLIHKRRKQKITRLTSTRSNNKLNSVTFTRLKLSLKSKWKRKMMSWGTEIWEMWYTKTKSSKDTMLRRDQHIRNSWANWKKITRNILLRTWDIITWLYGKINRPWRPVLKMEKWCLKTALNNRQI